MLLCMPPRCGKPDASLRHPTWTSRFKATEQHGICGGRLSFSLTISCPKKIRPAPHLRTDANRCPPKIRNSRRARSSPNLTGTRLNHVSRRILPVISQRRRDRHQSRYEHIRRLRKILYSRCSAPGHDRLCSPRHGPRPAVPNRFGIPEPAVPARHWCGRRSWI